MSQRTPHQVLSWALLLTVLLLPARLAAFEVRYEKTGYAVTSGMDYAIRYELKQLIARHEQVLRRKAPAEINVSYRIFNTYEEYKAYSAAQGRAVSPQLLGYTASKKSYKPDSGEIVSAQAEVITWKHPQAAVLLATVLHETTHAVTQSFLLHVPLWMNEGSADWFGKPAWAESEAQKSDRARRWLTLRFMLDEKKLPPLRAYLEAESYDEWSKQFGGNIGMGYVVGYSLFDYFMSAPTAQNFLGTLLKAPTIERGAKPGALFTAQLDKLWRGGLPEFERGWHNWIRYKAGLEKPPGAKP
ncbi:MAG: hypothetical protein EBS05_14000 [Proteobacteria bacterium]|nr:hypothetical protein [Pseudomonadota bacterium]